MSVPRSRALTTLPTRGRATSTLIHDPDDFLSQGAGSYGGAGSVVADDPCSYAARFTNSFMKPESVATHSGSTAL